MVDSNASANRPLATRTTDPEAASYDEASRLVQTGLQHARSGSIDVGLPLIACAFLLDSRVIEFKPVLQHNEDDPLKHLDMDLLQQLIDYDSGNNVASQVLMIYAAILFGQAEGARSRTLQALRVSSNIITDITNDPTMEDANRGILGGCLKRVTLHRMRATLYLSLELPNAAVEELSEALLLNPNLTSIACQRAVLCAILSYKTDQELVHDFRRVTRHAHPDARELRETYAWLAKLILGNPELGSIDQAYRYLQLSRSAKARHDEIYGPSTSLLIESEVEAAFKAHQITKVKSRQSPIEEERVPFSPKHFTFQNFTNTKQDEEEEDDDRDASETSQSEGNVSSATVRSHDDYRRTPFSSGLSASELMKTIRQMATHSDGKIWAPATLESPPMTKNATPRNDQVRSPSYMDSPPKTKMTTRSDYKIKSPSYVDSPPKTRTPIFRRAPIACTACGTSATRENPLSMCSRCCGAFYCSKECQRSKVRSRV